MDHMFMLSWTPLYPWWEKAPEDFKTIDQGIKQGIKIGFFNVNFLVISAVSFN